MSIVGTSCNRCHKPAGSLTGSFFNTDMLCQTCQDKEEAHPKFKEAKAIEEAEVKKGNYNFPGVGKPADL